MAINFILIHAEILETYIPQVNTSDPPNNRHCGTFIESKFLKFILKYRIKFNLIEQLKGLLLHFIGVRPFLFYTLFQENVSVCINIVL